MHLIDNLRIPRKLPVAFGFLILIATGFAAPANTSKPVRKRPADSHAAPRPLVRGNTALALKTEPAEQGWEEF